MSEWKNCRKKLVSVIYREVNPDEEGVETLEGYKPVSPDTHFVIKGVVGEEYPIRKDVFYKTYDVVRRNVDPIEITDAEILEQIQQARGMEWSAEHMYRRYKDKIQKIFDRLEALYELDFKKEVWKIDKVDGKNQLIYIREIIK